MNSDQNMGSRNYKTVKGKEYLYYVTQKNSKPEVTYCGPVSKLESEKKALDMEVIDLEKQKNIIEKKLKQITRKLTIVEQRLK